MLVEVIGVNAPGEEFYYTPTQISLSAATQSLMMALMKLYFVILIQRNKGLPREVMTADIFAAILLLLTFVSNSIWCIHQWTKHEWTKTENGV